MPSRLTLRRAALARARQNPAAPDTAAAVRRIDELSRTARGSWLGLLGYLAFVGVTLLGVKDADFFIPSRQTQLPLINVAIPTTSFFAFAPVLGAALYVYLHLHLCKLWNAVGAARHTYGGAAVQAGSFPWLISDLALTYPGPNAAPREPLTWVSSLVTLLLVWAAGPAALLGFWWRSHPAHEELTTLLIALCVLLALYVGFTSWLLFCAAARGPGPRPRLWRRILRNTAFAVFAVWLLFVGWVRTEGSFDRYVHRYTNPLYGWESLDRVLAPIDLRGVRFTNPPASWTDPDTAQDMFRTTWCGREGLSPQICGQVYSDEHPAPEHVKANRLAWCADRYAATACDTYFTGLDRRFLAAAAAERDRAVDAIPGIDLSARDLRFADLRGAFLDNANLVGARLEWANLEGAQLEGARLCGVSTEGTMFIRANMVGADLGCSTEIDADVSGTSILARPIFRDTNLARAVFRGRDLIGANFKNTKLDGADFSSTYMTVVDFIGADLRGASFRGARADGVRFLDSLIDGSTDLRLYEAKHLAVRGTDLSQVQLNKEDWTYLLANTFGDASVTLPGGVPRPAHWLPEAVTYFGNEWSSWREKSPVVPR